MADRGGWTSDRIRTLRGERSRPAFAAALGVSALTVYRWELPDGAPEARRPRGAILKRLEALAAGAPVPRVALAAPRADDEGARAEVASLAPALDALMDGRFRRAEQDLVGLLASGALRSGVGRALATQALARVQLWERADVRGAFSTLFPLLAEVDEGRLPSEVAREVHVTAALVFSGLDGRLFDAGKVSAHAARALRLLDRGDARARFLLWFAQVSAAYTLSDPALLQLQLERADEVAQDLSSPLLRCLGEEVRAIWGYYAGRPALAARHFGEGLRLAREHGFALQHARAVLQALRQRVDDGEPPDATLDALVHVEALLREARAVPGWHSMFIAYAAGEAHARAGRIPDAEATLREGLRVAEEIRWPAGTLPLFLARLWLLTGRAGALRPLASRLLAAQSAVFADVDRCVAECVAALADVVEGGDGRDAVERFGAAVRRAEAAGAWSFLRRNLALADASFALLAGSAEQAARAMRRAEQTLDAAPSEWSSAAMDALRGLRAWQEGRPQDARAPIERALATFTRAGDVLHTALTRLAYAAALADLGAAEAASVRAEGEEALRRMGVAPPTIARREAGARPSPASGAEPVAETTRLSGALGRIALRGVSPSRLQATLVDVLSGYFPGSGVRLEEVDSHGRGTTLGGVGGVDAEVMWEEFGDGSGRRLRIGVGGPVGTDGRAALSALAAAAGLALEVASLRGLVDRAAPGAGAEVQSPEVPGMVAASPAMRRLRSDLARLSRSRSTIIVTGESGSGKEVVARALHDLSARRGGPYVTFNCAAVPRDLFEGQLFGYRRGAFTGAATDHAGVIRAADRGTLFLDEVGELPLDVQPKLLRFLENGEVFPLGETRPVQVDVRVIAATFRDLEADVREGRFREDLFYRLHVVPIRVPPLRERPEDVLALARHFLRRFTPEGETPPSLAPDAVVALASHAWPGNVRELRNVIERALAFEPLPASLGAEHLGVGAQRTKM